MKFKMKRFVDLIQRMGEVTMSDFDQSGQSRLQSLIELGIVTRVIKNYSTEEPIYSLVEERIKQQGHKKYI